MDSIKGDRATSQIIGNRSQRTQNNVPVWIFIALALLGMTVRVNVVVGQASAPGSAATSTNENEARARFQQGLALARAGNCRGAIAEFEASLRLIPRPSTVFNIAQCQEELQRYDLAVRDYRRFLELAPPDASERVTAESALRMLERLLGTIHIRSNVPAEVWLEDRIIGNAPGDVLVPGGRHAIELRAPSYLPARRQVDVMARGAIELDIELEKAQQTVHQTFQRNVTVERPPLSPAVFWTGVGISAAALLTGTIAGANALRLHNKEKDRSDPRVPPDTDPIKTSALIADIAFITGGVCAAGTIVAAFLTDWGSKDESERPPSRASLHRKPKVKSSVSFTGMGVAWGGSF